jgi:putative radical SAM enzyme (TIGR03279 family)
LTYFTEIDWDAERGGRVVDVEGESLASHVDIRPGDELLAVNHNQVNDVIDVNYYGSEENLEILIRRGSEYLVIEAERDYGEALGIVFEHPTFDTDILRCNNLCEFCFVLQMAPRFRRTLYIKDDDYRYSFLFGHFVTLTNLSDHDWWRIETMGLSPLYVSVHVTDTAMRRRFLRNDNAPDIIEQLSWLKDRGVEVHTQIVVVPEFNDGNWLRRSVDELAELWPSVKSISVVPVGLTRFHKYGMRPHTAQESMTMLDDLDEIQQQFRERLGCNFVYPTDEWYLVAGRAIPPIEAYDGQELQENGLGMVRSFLEEWDALRAEITREETEGEDPPGSYGFSTPTAVTLVTGTLFAGTLTKIADEFGRLSGITVSVQGVTNKALGRTITVAGLLNAADIIAHLAESGYGSLVILPFKAFDHPDRISLDNYTPQQVADQLKTDVALAESMGDVWDAVSGTSSLYYSPVKEAE